MTIQSGTVNIRINKKTHSQLSELAKANSISMQSMLERAVEAYRRQKFLVALNEDFAALRRNQKEWQDEIEERKLWEQTLSDGVGS